MEIIKTIIENYGMEILGVILTGLMTWLGTQFASLYKKFVDSTEKRKVAKTVVTAVEQLYKDLGGPEKFEKAVEAASQMLENKGIIITELEIKMLIEEAVGTANNVFEKYTEAENAEVEG